MHLSGPLQSWGEHSPFAQRDTALFPTRSAIIGLIAAALGRPRHEPIDDLRHLRVAVRADKPGTLLRDFHTVGGGQPAKMTVATGERKPRPGDTGTLISHRYYLQDAAFTVALTADAEQADLLGVCRRALEAPVWATYLGRRSCPPSGPLLIGETPDAWRALTHLPLHRAAVAERSSRYRPIVPVAYYADQTLAALPLPQDCSAEQAETTSVVNDEPVSYVSMAREYRGRTVYRRIVHTPQNATRFGGLGADYLKALANHLNSDSETEERTQ